MDRLWMWLAWRMPHRLAYWCAVRVGAHASMIGGNEEVSSFTVLKALERWDVRFVP